MLTLLSTENQMVDCNLPPSLWHNSLITISIFREFWSETIREDYNFFLIYLDGNIPVRLKPILRTSRVEFWDKTSSNVS